MNKKLFYIFALFLGLLIVSGCKPSNNQSTKLPALADETVLEITTTTGPISTDTSHAPEVLPNSLYFLANSNEIPQIFKLDKDGIHKVQITHEEAGIDEYTVSSSDGSIAYISGNRLFIQNNNEDTPLLLVDPPEIDPSVADYSFRAFLSNPSFSPDGRFLAYALDGLHLYNLLSGVDKHLLTNLGNLTGEPYVFAKEAYTPGDWSPDGRQLLIIMGYYEGSTLAIMDLDAEEPFHRLWSHGTVCCIFTWTADSRSILVANPYFTTDLPGLWQYDAKTGQQTEIISGQAEDGSLNYVGWPLQLDNGQLLFFFTNQKSFSPDVGIPLRMTRSDADGSHMVTIRPDEYRISDVLWSPDGSMAVISHKNVAGNLELIVVPTDGKQPKVIIEGSRIRNLMWGP